MISAPSASPSFTFWMASALLFTGTGSIAPNSFPPCTVMSIRCPPSSTVWADSGSAL